MLGRSGCNHLRNPALGMGDATGPCQDFAHAQLKSLALM